MVADPVRANLNSEPSISGYSSVVPLKSQFKVIADALPKVRTVGMLYNSKTKKGQEFLKTVKANLPKGWRLEAVAIDKYKSVAEAINNLFERDIHIVWTAPDSTIYNRATVRSLLLTSIRRKVPVFGFSLSFVKAGSLLGTTIDPETQGKQTAQMIHRSLQAKNQKIEMHEEVKYEVALNLIVAEQLDITLPKTMITKSKYVIKNKND